MAYKHYYYPIAYADKKREKAFKVGKRYYCILLLTVHFSYKFQLHTYVPSHLF
jgi:hypothetical protein